jgi:hypothetical protein
MYRFQGGCVIGSSQGCNTPRSRWVPSPLEPCALATIMRDLGTDSIPTGYKSMRRVPHSEEGSALDQLTKRNRPLQRGKRIINSNAERSYICGVMARAPLLLGTRFRRQPLAPSGATLRAPGG